MWERPYDSHGNETDGWGVPYAESFSQKELKRLMFEVFMSTQDDTDTSPDPEFETVPEPPPPPHVRQMGGNWKKINGIWIRK